MTETRIVIAHTGPHAPRFDAQSGGYACGICGEKTDKVCTLCMAWGEHFTIDCPSLLQRNVMPEPLKYESILEEAQRLTHGPRNATYGSPHKDYAKVAQMFNALVGHKLNEPLTAMDMALAMCCVKLSRQAHSPKRDNMVDLAGYAYVAQDCAEHQK